MKIRRSELKKARIEIIPMIDTIFFLLVYFMMMSLTMVQMSAYKVNLPQSTTAEGKPLEKIVVSLSKAGNYYVNQKMVSFSDLAPQLQQYVTDNPYGTIVVNVDKDQTEQEFMPVLNIAQAAGPGDLVIATTHAGK